MLQAYVVFKYSEKEQPQTTIRGGSKYVAAPLKSASTHMSTLNSSTACNSMGADKLCDEPLLMPPECGGGGANSMEKDIQVGRHLANIGT